jgi:hypothetical protein
MPGAHDEIRTLLPPTLRLGTGRAVTALATELRDGEQAISLVSGSVDALPRAQRTHLLCVTDQALLLASVTGGSARRFDYGDLESFSSRNSNPGSYALDFVTLGVLKSLSCQYVLRIRDGQRITLSNIRPERRAFTVARRIEFYRRRGKLPRLPTSDAVQEAAATAKHHVGRLAGRVLEAARRTGGLPQAPPTQAPSEEPPLERHDDVSDADLLSHLLALHEAGLITDAELAAKKAALGIER